VLEQEVHPRVHTTKLFDLDVVCADELEVVTVPSDEVLVQLRGARRDDLLAERSMPEGGEIALPEWPPAIAASRSV
jgi:hypothetical protein